MSFALTTNKNNKQKANTVMKNKDSLPRYYGLMRIPLGLVLAVAGSFLHQDATAIPLTVDLGTASSFAVLAGSGITITGPTTITGDIGTHPTPSITGFENVTLNGVNHADDAVTAQAKIDLVTAYNDAFGRTANETHGSAADLVGLSLFSGVYKAPDSLFLNGTLTLDAQGNPDAVWIFQAGTTLITGSESEVIFKDGVGSPWNVFWQVGSSATLGTGTDFTGTILALESITLNTGATVEGGVMARNGAVTLDNNTITISDHSTASSVPDSGSTLAMLGAGLTTLLGFSLRFSSRPQQLVG